MDIKTKITETLQNIIDPELRVNVMELGLIKAMDVDDNGNVSFVFRPSSKQCPIGIQLAVTIKQKILELDEVHSVHMDIENFIYKEQLKEILKSIK
ncbi:MAG: iron-sulfur cluster assembly protein [candidate division WOR-3 bacterium]|nr:iron-sulfur cluster assembly protein [candidate division WOR-3 bacterium]